MNKTDLAQQFKVSNEQIDAALNAGDLPTNLESYTDEHKKTVEAIFELVNSKQVASINEAGERYRKPLNEAQLTKITAQYKIASDRIPEILGGLKLKIETLKGEQFKLFESVCSKVASGMDLAIAVQSVLENVKGSKSKKAAPPPPAQATAALAAPTNGKNGSAIAAPQTSGDPDWIGMDTLPETAVNDLRELANGEFTHKHDDLIAGATDGIYDVMDNLTPEVAHQVGVNIAREAITSVMAAAAHTGAPRRVIEEVKKRRRPK